MNYQDREEFHFYLGRVKPLYHQLFNTAHALTGNAAQAEYCLQYALLDCWKSGESSRHALRDALKRSLLRAAWKCAASDAPDWDALQAPADDPDAMRRLISQESNETRRVLALKHGCGLSAGRIAKLIELDANRVRQLLDRFEARARRRLTPAERKKYDFLLQRAIRSFFSEPSPLAPEMNGVFRSFQADAAEVAQPGKLPARIVKWFFAALLALICIAAFWLTAVLVQPPVLEEAPQAEFGVQSVQE